MTCGAHLVALMAGSRRATTLHAAARFPERPRGSASAGASAPAPASQALAARAAEELLLVARRERCVAPLAPLDADVDAEVRIWLSRCCWVPPSLALAARALRWPPSSALPTTAAVFAARLDTPLRNTDYRLARRRVLGMSSEPQQLSRAIPLARCPFLVGRAAKYGAANAVDPAPLPCPKMYFPCRKKMSCGLVASHSQSDRAIPHRFGNHRSGGTAAPSIRRSCRRGCGRCAACRAWRFGGPGRAAASD